MDLYLSDSTPPCQTQSAILCLVSVEIHVTLACGTVKQAAESLQAGGAAILDAVQKDWRQLMQAATLAQARRLLSHILIRLQRLHQSGPLAALTVGSLFQDERNETRAQH